MSGSTAERRHRPIARIWNGKVRRSDANRYASLMRSAALPDYRATPGNIGAWVLRRDAEIETEFTMLSMWDSVDAVRGFAGDPVDRARYYDFDAHYLLAAPERVAHFVIDSEVVGPSMDAREMVDPQRLLGGACELAGEELRDRLAEWSAVAARAVGVDTLPGGLRLTFASSEPLDQLATLVAQESECCAFYRFTLRVDGPARILEIDAGRGNASVARALVGLD